MIPVLRQAPSLRPHGSSDSVPRVRAAIRLRAAHAASYGKALLLGLWMLAPTAALEAATSEPSEGCTSLRALGESARVLIDRGGTFVTLEAREGERVKRGLAVRRVAAPLSAVRDVILDHERMPKLTQALKSARITGQDGTATLVRQVLDLPFPLRNRHYTLRLVTSERADCLESSWTYVPGSGNIADTFGRWEILHLEPGVVLLAYVATADPGGWIPAFAANWVARRALPEVLEHVAEAAEAAGP